MGVLLFVGEGVSFSIILVWCVVFGEVVTWKGLQVGLRVELYFSPPLVHSPEKPHFLEQPFLALCIPFPCVHPPSLCPTPRPPSPPGCNATPPLREVVIPRKFSGGGCEVVRGSCPNEVVLCFLL